MRYNIVGIFDSTLDKFIEAKPLIYYNGTWHNVNTKVYSNNEWKQIGGAGVFMVPFLTSNGEYFYTIDEKLLLVKEHS